MLTIPSTDAVIPRGVVLASSFLLIQTISTSRNAARCEHVRAEKVVLNGEVQVMGGMCGVRVMCR